MSIVCSFLSHKLQKIEDNSPKSRFLVGNNVYTELGLSTAHDVARVRIKPVTSCGPNEQCTALFNAQFHQFRATLKSACWSFTNQGRGCVRDNF